MTSSIASFALSKLGSKKAKRTASGIVPRTINTGRSTFDTRTGQARLDPTIRASQDRFGTNIRDLIPDADAAFTEAGQGISDLRTRLSGISSDFEGNQSNFREAQLAEVRETIANRTGDLDRELNRTGVRGTFAQQARNALAFDSSRELRRAEAFIENERVNKLGDFLQIDADLLKSGLATETGRIGLLSQLESTLASVSSERFQQEMQLLGLPGQFIQGNTRAAQIRSNAEGIEAQAGADLVGSALDLFG